MVRGQIFFLTTSTIVVVHAAVPHMILWMQLCCRFGSTRDGVGQQFWIFDYFLDDFHKDLSNAHFGLGGGLQKEHSLTPGPSFGLFSGHGAFQIDFVAHQQLDDVFSSVGGIELDFLEPLFQVFETVRAGDVVDEDDSVGTPIIARREGSEALLSGGIPNGQLDALPVHVHVLDFEIHANSGLDVFVERVVRES